jgi:hypothetical protein
MDTSKREMLQTVLRLAAQALNGEPVRRISTEESLRLVPQLVTLLKSVLDITDAELVLSAPIE